MPPRRDIPLQTIVAHFKYPIDHAAFLLQTCSSVLKRICRLHSIRRWPYQQLRYVDQRLYQLKLRGQLTPNANGAEIIDLMQQRCALLNRLTAEPTFGEWSPEEAAAFQEVYSQVASTQIASAARVPTAGQRKRQTRAQRRRTASSDRSDASAAAAAGAVDTPSGAGERNTSGGSRRPRRSRRKRSYPSSDESDRESDVSYADSSEPKNETGMQPRRDVRQPPAPVPAPVVTMVSSAASAAATISLTPAAATPQATPAAQAHFPQPTVAQPLTVTVPRVNSTVVPLVPRPAAAGSAGGDTTLAPPARRLHGPQQPAPLLPSATAPSGMGAAGWGASAGVGASNAVRPLPVGTPEQSLPLPAVLVCGPDPMGAGVPLGALNSGWPSPRRSSALSSLSALTGSYPRGSLTAPLSPLPYAMPAPAGPAPSGPCASVPRAAPRRLAAPSLAGQPAPGMGLPPSRLPSLSDLLGPGSAAAGLNPAYSWVPAGVPALPATPFLTGAAGLAPAVPVLPVLPSLAPLQEWDLRVAVERFFQFQTRALGDAQRR